MPMPNGGLITETNRQYYEGAQSFRGDGTDVTFTTTFNTDLIWYASNPSSVDYALNNFKLYTSLTGAPGTFTEFTGSYTVTDNTINFTTPPVANSFIVVQLKILTGGNYGGEDAYGNTV